MSTVSDAACRLGLSQKSAAVVVPTASCTDCPAATDAGGGCSGMAPSSAVAVTVVPSAALAETPATVGTGHAAEPALVSEMIVYS